jgi:hypothetical protein
MGTTDGSVIGQTQIWGSAPRNHAFNIVLLAEGFTAAQQNDFNAACSAFANALWATPPFDRLGLAINVFRVNVSSTDSGADDPVAAGGTGAQARTYFDASFGGNNIRRLLLCNTTTALTVAAAQIPEFTVVIVVVNSTVYGGSGGSVGTYSLAAGATEIAIHEMGHTAFHFADEYAYYAGGNETGHDHHPAGEPFEPNVTTNTNRATLKWRAVVAATTALPTMANPNCAQVDSRPSTVPAGTVGLFEGAHYYHCGAYRPEYSCKMQSLGVPFCRVCRDVISSQIHPLLGTRISLWKVDAHGSQVNFKEHGPFGGWTPLNCANNNVLWRHDDGRISFWVIDDQGNQVSFKEHGPFGGWMPLNYADGRILWRRADGRISLWRVDAQGNQVNFKEHGPFAGWTPLNCADNNVLWRHNDGRISFWVVDDQGNQVSFKEHGPFGGWTAVNYADGRILWRR